MKDEMLKGSCKACESGVGLLSGDALTEGLAGLKGWTCNADRTAISRTFEFSNFYKTMAFVNAVAWIANREDHHPDLEVGYSKCKVVFSTHSAGGITDNDLICAKAVDALDGSPGEN